MRPSIRSHMLAGAAAIAVLSWFPTGLALNVTPAAAQAQSISAEFRTALEPYGSFQRVARWGEVWVPNDVPRNWRPYTVGHWVNSNDYGWYWVSDQAEAAWGWVTFHYGRWVWIRDTGWAWVPGREWAPAWVDWRRGGRYVGWAPLPPDDIIVDVRDDPQYWIFVQPADFLAPRLTTVIVEPEPVFFRDTVVVNETVVFRDRGFAVNPGIEPAFLAAAIGRPIPQFAVRPRVFAFAGTAQIPGAIQVRADDLRRSDFRSSITQQTNIRATSTMIRPAANVPQPQALGRGEHGRLGQNPPRAASGLASQTPSPQPGSSATVPGQQRERGATGPTAPEQQRGVGERGPTSALPGQQRERGAAGPTAPQQQQREQRGATGPTAEQQRGRLYDRAAPSQGPQRGGPQERGATGPTPNQMRGGGEMRQHGASGGPAPQAEPGRGLYNRATPGPGGGGGGAPQAVPHAQGGGAAAQAVPHAQGGGGPPQGMPHAQGGGPGGGGQRQHGQ